MWMRLGIRGNLLRLFTGIRSSHFRLLAKWCKNSLSKSVYTLTLMLACILWHQSTLIDKCSVKLWITLGLKVGRSTFFLDVWLNERSHRHTDHCVEVASTLHILLGLSSRSIARVALLASRRLDKALPGLLWSLQLRRIKSGWLIRDQVSGLIESMRRL